MTVSEVTVVTDDLVDAVGRLVSQLSSSAAPPSRAELEAIVASPATTLLVAGELVAGELVAGEPAVGMLTLAVFRIPTGVRAWIEDVVVDRSARGGGVGEALSRRAIELAAAAGARTVDLTSRPSREAANRLYRRLGFEIRQTNVYRFRAG
ncbi:MAG: GNAT family N-acetyltransferase [Acidimicrobiales bacterium]